MANVKILRTSFTGGEIAPEMYGRIDDNAYQNGLGLCRNFVVKPQGAVENRAGFEFVRQVKYPYLSTRLVPFFFNIDQTLVLEFGDKYVRFHTQGATVLDSAGEPYEVQTPYAAEDVFDIHYVQSADVLTLVHPNYAPRELRRYGATDWRLTYIDFTPTVAPPQGVGIEAKWKDEDRQYTYEYVVTAVSGDDGSESETSAAVSITNNLLNFGTFNTIRWQKVDKAQYYNVYRKYGGIFCFVGQATGTEFVDENITPDASKTPPIYDEMFATGGITKVEVLNGGSGYVGDGSITGVQVANNITASSSVMPRERYQVGVEKEGKFERRFKFDFVNAGSNVSRPAVVWMKPLYDNPERGATEWNDGIKYTVDSVHDGGNGYPVNTAIGFFEYRSKRWEQRPFLATVTTTNNLHIEIDDETGYGAELVPVVENNRITGVEVRKSGYSYTNPTLRVVGGGGSGAVLGNVQLAGKDYPGAVSYFQQRRVFAGSESRPQTVWMTKSGTESNMSYAIPVRDDDRVQITVAAREASRILHIVPLTGLVLMTAAAEWRMSGGGSEVITPDTVQVSPQSFIGANNVQPVIVNNVMVYASSRGGHIRELGYNWQAGGFVTGDISLRAPHLFDNDDIADLTLAKTPVPVVWAVTKTGKLLGCTYLPEQNLGAWHQHDTTHGRFLSCAAVAEGAADALYVVTERVINGDTTRYIERMAGRAFAEQKEAFFVDCGSTYRGEPTDTLDGLFYLEGETVSILADGAVMPPQKVVLGRIKLQEKASVIHVGLPIYADLETLPIAAQIDSAFGQGRMKNINKVWLRVNASGGIFAGPDADRLTEVKQRTTENLGTPPRLKSEEIRLNITPSWNDSGTVYIRQYDPLPITVVSLTAEVSAGG